MNSNSRYLEEVNCRRDRDNDNRGRRQAEVSLKCSAPGSVAIPIIAEAGTTFTATSLTVNNKNFCNPTRRLDFTSNIVAPVGFTGTITFQVFKQCRNQLTAVPVGPSFTYSRTVALVVGEANTFSFFICDCDACDDDCCTYTVRITNQTPIALLGLTVNNATLSAITVNNGSNCGC